MVLITYDVNTQTEAGKARLRKVAKQCLNYGTRVQNSVFECVIEPYLFKEVQSKLKKLIDPTVDSLRFYYLGSDYKKKVEHIGAKETAFIEDNLIL